MNHGWNPARPRACAQRRRGIVVACLSALVLIGAGLVTIGASVAVAAPKALLRYEGADDGVHANYVIKGSWDHTDLTYSFVSHSRQLSPDREDAAIRQALDLWQNASSLRFTEVPSGGDISIGFAPIDGGFNGHEVTILGRTFTPPYAGLYVPAPEGDVTFDVDENWTDTDTSVNPPIDLVVVAAHELGHAIGLGHSTDNSSLMSPAYIPHHRFLSPDDIAAVQALYPCVDSCGSGGTTTASTTTTVAPPPAFSISDANPVTEPTSTYSTKATFTVTLSRAVTSTARVHYETHDGTANEPSDYLHRGGTLTFSAGSTSKTISITVKRDKLPEPEETFRVVLSAPSNAGIADDTGIGTIRANGNDLPTFSIGDAKPVTEPTYGTVYAKFTITLSAPASGSTRVHYATVDGTATDASGDYTGHSGTVYFSPGTTSKVISISVRADKLKELTETFSVMLSDPYGAGIANGMGTARIIDVD